MFRRFRAFEASPTVEFRDPDTGYVFRSDSLPALYKLIILYRHQNNLDPIESLSTVVENYLCGLPENCNKCQGVELHRSFGTYIKGGIQLLKNMAFKKFATQKVADERASQCVKCKYNVFPDKGPFMAWSDDVAIMQVGERKTALHNELANCEICTCSLKSKCFFDGKLDPFPEDQLVNLKSVNCWQLKLSGQDK